jgi:hypothetical protein
MKLYWLPAMQVMYKIVLVCVLFYSIAKHLWSKKGHKKGQFEPARVRKLNAKQFSCCNRTSTATHYILHWGFDKVSKHFFQNMFSMTENFGIEQVQL